MENIGSIGEVGSTKDFLVECTRSLERAFEEDHTVENASIELKTLRMASNVSQSKVRSVVMEQVCELVSRQPEKLTKWIELVKSLMGGDEDLMGMEELLFDLQTWTVKYEGLRSKFFSRMLQTLYNSDVISEEGLLQWFKNQRSKEIGGTIGLELRGIGGRMLQMIMDDDDDDDEDEDE